MAQGVCVVLSTAEREQLAAIAADRNRPGKHVERARIVLASADRHSAQWVAQSIGVSRPTVWRWQQRFAESGIDALLRDKTRKPGKAPIAAEITARVVALTCTEPPHQATHWTGRAMANPAASRWVRCSASGGRTSCSRTACAPSSAGGRRPMPSEARPDPVEAAGLVPCVKVIVPTSNATLTEFPIERRGRTSSRIA